MSGDLVGGMILCTIGLAAIALIVWIIVDMSARGKGARGALYALTFFICWPVGLPLWLTTRSRWPKADQPPPSPPPT